MASSVRTLPRSLAPARFTLVACDGSDRLGEIDTYESATIVARFNDISSWEVSLPADSAGYRLLAEASRPRILILEAGGEAFRSGPLIRPERENEADSDFVSLAGVDDLIWLRRRLAHPQPGSAAPPYSAQATDNATGPTAQVIAGYVDRNAGPAAVAARRVAGLVVPPQPALGPSVTVSARYENLFDLVRPLAEAAGLGLRITDLEFGVFEPTGHAHFSANLGTLAGWTSTAEAPEANYVYVGGSGEGTARVIREQTDAASVGEWGRVEEFIDRRDTANVAELDTEAAGRLAEAVIPPAVQMQAIDTEGQRFGVDWSLGSLATVRIGETVYEQVIREVTILLEGNRPPRITPTLGGSVGLNLWRRLDSLDRRLRQLERI